MQGLWYGDKRDRVKWGALVHLANTKGIRCIVQVAYFRHGTDLKLQTEEGEVELPVQVWNHFSNLRHIERLGEATGLKIIVLDQLFDPGNRFDYINMICLHLEEINKEIKNRKIIFLDPDTGIEPENAKPEHVTKNDLREIWEKIGNGDLLAVYQHAAFTENWLNDRKKRMSVVCDNVCVKHILSKGIAQDMAMLWCCKGTTNEDAPKSPPAVLKPVKTAKAGRLCACPCGQMTKGGYFCRGHDEKLKSIFRKVTEGEKDKKDLDKTMLKMYELREKDESMPLKDIAKEVLGE
jgi:hypothetical protein